MIEEKKQIPEEEKEKAGLSIFSIFALAAAAGLIVAFFLPMLVIDSKIVDELKKYKAEFEENFKKLEDKIQVLKKEYPDLENVEIDTEEFGDFFKEYGFLMPKLKKLKATDIEKFREIIDALFIFLEKGTPQSLYKFAEVIDKNKDFLKDPEASQAITRNIQIVVTFVKWLSLATIISGILLIVFVLVSKFGKFNPVFLVLTYFSGFSFFVVGGFSLFVMPKIPELFTTYGVSANVKIPTQIIEFLSNISIGTGMHLTFAAGILMLIVALFGISKKNFGIVYALYFVFSIVIGFVILSKFNII